MECRLVAALAAAVDDLRQRTCEPFPAGVVPAESVVVDGATGVLGPGRRAGVGDRRAGSEAAARARAAVAAPLGSCRRVERVEQTVEQLERRRQLVGFLKRHGEVAAGETEVALLEARAKLRRAAEVADRAEID